MQHLLKGLVPLALRASPHASACQQQLLASACSRGFKAVADVEVNLADRETLKKYVGVRDHLSKQPATKATLIAALRELLEAVKVLPEASDYRKAVEADSNYRLKVIEANTSDAAIEEVLDVHLEEAVNEAQQEIKLIPVIQGERPRAAGAAPQPPRDCQSGAATAASCARCRAVMVHGGWRCGHGRRTRALSLRLRCVRARSDQAVGGAVHIPGAPACRGGGWVWGPAPSPHVRRLRAPQPLCRCDGWRAGARV